MERNKKIAELLAKSKAVVSDGAWGTLLQQAGLKPGECPELWCVNHADIVEGVAREYAAAGAAMIKTNSFGGNVFKLKHYGLDGQADELNEAAVRLSKNAAGGAIVIASMGPTGEMLVTEEVTEEELYDVFRSQAEALERGGADAVCIETMSDIEEACVATKAVRENTRLEVICSFTFDRTVRGDYRTMMGVSPTNAAIAAAEAGADVVGTNCGNGMEQMVEIIAEMRQAVPEIPLYASANAGSPKLVDGVNIFPNTPEDMARLIPAMIEAGANIIGGCCGTTPAHIRAMLWSLQPRI